ncbi:MAG TPA: hypothetical protein VJG83_00225 [archaeon]|nr:hypothetical protein [archaeon]
MGRFTPDQKKIAVMLLSSPKSADELHAQLNIPFHALNEDLKKMLKMKLIKLDGYPQKYSLVENIVSAVKRRKEIAEKDPFDVRLKAVIEVKAVEQKFLAKQIKEIEDKLAKEKVYTIYDIYKAPPIEDAGYYSSYLELNLSAKDFTALVKFMYFYGPTSVEVLKPAKVVLAMDDLQDALMEMAEMIQSYNEAMLKSMKKDELAKFAKDLYKPNA